MKLWPTFVVALPLASTLSVLYAGPPQSQERKLLARMPPVNRPPPAGGGSSSRKPVQRFPKKTKVGGGTYHPGQSLGNPQVRKQLESAPGYPSGFDPLTDDEPSSGDEGVYVDHAGGNVASYYGDRMPNQGDSVKYHTDSYPQSKNSRYGSTTQNKDQGRRAMNGLPVGVGPSVKDEGAPKSFDWMAPPITPKTKYGYDPNIEDTTSMAVPDGESRMQGRMLNVAKQQADRYGYTKSHHDNRKQTANYRGNPLRGPDLNDGRPLPYHATNQNSGYKHRKTKRADLDPVNNINSQISSTTTNSTTDLQSQYQMNLLAYQTVQANATDLLFDYIDTILAMSNLSIIHEMAFSLLQIVDVNEGIVGSFMYGETNLNWWADQMTQNMTDEQKENDLNVQLMYASCYALNDFYDQVWENATAAANATGLLADMETLGGYLITNDTSLIPQSELTVDTDGADYPDDYFYQNIDDAGSFTNGTLPLLVGTASAPLPTGSGGNWLYGTAIGGQAPPASTGSGSPPIDNGFSAVSQSQQTPVPTAVNF